jgi:acetyltransferase-like isoleucine patch superfamily enzyme
MAESLGDGRPARERFAAYGTATVVEPFAVVIHPERIELGDDVYVGHFTLLDGGHLEGSKLILGSGCYLGSHCYVQGLGGVRIGEKVGIGPSVIMLTSMHAETPPGTPITAAPVRFGAIEISDGCDIGVGSVLLPGTHLGEGVQVGAGAVVRGAHPGGSVIAGMPARVLRARGEGDWAADLAASPTCAR